MDKNRISQFAQQREGASTEAGVQPSTTTISPKSKLLVAIITLMFVMSAFVGVSIASAVEDDTADDPAIEGNAEEGLGSDESDDVDGMPAADEFEADEQDSEDITEPEPEEVEVVIPSDSASSSSSAAGSSSASSPSSASSEPSSSSSDPVDEGTVIPSSSSAAAPVIGQSETPGPSMIKDTQPTKFNEVFNYIIVQKVSPGYDSLVITDTLDSMLVLAGKPTMTINGTAVNPKDESSGNTIKLSMPNETPLTGQADESTVEVTIPVTFAENAKGTINNTAKVSVNGKDQSTNVVSVTVPMGKLKVDYALESGSTDESFDVKVEYTYKVGTDAKEVTKNEKKTIKPTKTKGSFTISDIPAGATYTVTLDPAKKDGFLIAMAGDKGTITKDATAEASILFAGERKVPTKTINGQTSAQTLASRTASFTYVVTQEIPVTADSITITDKIDSFLTIDSTIVRVNDKEVSNAATVSGNTVKATVSGSTIKSARGKNMTLTIVCKFNSKATDAEIIDAYGSAVNQPGKVPNSATSEVDGMTTLVDGKTKLATKTVEVSRPFPKLALTKVLSGTGLTATDRSKNFTFNLTLQNANGKAISGSFSNVNFKNGSATVSLKAGATNTKVLEIPSGYKYKVVESSSSKSGFTTKGEVTKATTMGEAKAVTITNTKATTTKANAAKTAAKTGDDNFGQIITLVVIAGLAVIALIVALVMRNRSKE